MGKRVAIIIGAGPAGLTAAFELLQKTGIKPIVFEASDEIGGISRTIVYKGNRMDIGGHRFFSKSDAVMAWWLNILPLEKTNASKTFTLKYQGKSRELEGGDGADPNKTDDVMLVRSRLSRIYYGGRFYNYPVTLEASTIKNLGPVRMMKMGVSYAKARIKPLPERSLEDFYVNRFGRELYNTFFRDYTEKVWGVPCAEIAPDWGAQRVKGLSVSKAVSHAVKKLFQRKPGSDISQKGTETSLIDSFLYPKLGPGHMWETVAKIVRKKGGEVVEHSVVTKVHADKSRIVSVDVFDTKTKRTRRVRGDYFFSTMPVKELIGAFEGVKPPKNVREVADGLLYRDFITVGLLLKKLKITNETGNKTAGNIVPDNWIYIQEPGVKVGRLQIFNNWSSYLVKDEGTVWIGMEYFVNEGDSLWNMADKDMAAFAIDELDSINIIDKADVIDSTVVRVKKTYPAYFGTYNRFSEIRKFTDKFENLFLLGRNGQHHYNNQDHSMLTAIESVSNIVNGRKDKDNVWDVNAEKDYHENKDEEKDSDDRSNRLKHSPGRFRSLHKFEWIIIGIIGFLFLTTLLAAHFTRPYGSDDIVVQTIFQSWEHGLPMHALVGSDNYILKVPFYLLEDLIFPYNSRLKIFIGVLFFAAILYATLIWFFKLYISRDKRRTKMAALLTFLPLAWYLGITALPNPSSNAVDISWVTNFMKTNSRNVEVGVALLLVAAWARYLDGRFELKKKRNIVVAVMLAVFTGAFFYNDPYFLVMLGGGAAIAVAVLWFSHRISNAKLVVSASFLSIALIIESILNILFKHFGYIARVQPFTFVKFSSLTVCLQNTGEALFKMFNADFWGMEVHSPHLKVFMINSTLLLYCSVAVIWAGKRLLKNLNVTNLLLISTITVTLVMYVISYYGLSAYDYRYTILAVFCSLPLLSNLLLHMSLDHKFKRLLYFTILLFILGISSNFLVNLQLLRSAVTNYSSHNPNAINYQVIDAALHEDATRGYGVYFDGPINSYLSNRSVIVIPVPCNGAGGQLKKSGYLYNFPDDTIPAKRTFFLTTHENLGPSNDYCGDKKHLSALGKPANIVRVNDQVTMYVYNGDIGPRLN